MYKGALSELLLQLLCIFKCLSFFIMDKAERKGYSERCLALAKEKSAINNINNWLSVYWKVKNNEL